MQEIMSPVRYKSFSQLRKLRFKPYPLKIFIIIILYKMPILIFILYYIIKFELEIKSKINYTSYESNVELTESNSNYTMKIYKLIDSISPFIFL